MNSKQYQECECVRRLFQVRGRQLCHIESPSPPAPDVRVIFSDESSETFEVTQIHPDEILGRGSAARSLEERQARRDPLAANSSWVRTDAMPAILQRINEKVEKSDGYVVAPNEPVSLLLVGSLPKSGAVVSTFTCWQFLSIDQLNNESNEILKKSHFRHAYLHLLIGNGLWVWDRTTGWSVLRRPDDSSHESWQMLAMLKSGDELRRTGLLPGTQIIGRWP